MQAKSIICCWAMGLTQHKNAVANIQEIVNFLLLRGNIGTSRRRRLPGARPQQRAGRPHHGHLGKDADEFLNRLGAEFAFHPPREHGLDTVETHQRHARRAASMCSSRMGGNFLSATPDTDFTAAALRNCRLTVQISTKLNRSHLITGQQALILPVPRPLGERFAGGWASVRDH